jgi:hypothetical protein
MANWGCSWFRKMACQKQMVSKMAGNPSASQHIKASFVFPKLLVYDA